MTTTWNPADKDSHVTLSGGNLVASTTFTLDYTGVRATTSIGSGDLKYFEYKFTAFAGSTPDPEVGIAKGTTSLTLTGEAGSVQIGRSGAVFVDGGFAGSIAGFVLNDVLGIAVDFNHAKIWFRTNAGGWNNDILANQNPASNTGGISFTTGAAYFPLFMGESDSGAALTVTANFGATTFANAAPSGFTGLDSGSASAGAASITEANDTATATGTLALAATASITEAADTSAASGAVPPVSVSLGTSGLLGEFDPTAANDAWFDTTTGPPSSRPAWWDDILVDAAGGSASVGSASITEAGDSATATGALALAAAASPAEAADTSTAAGAVAVSGAASPAEAADTLTATGALALAGTASQTEAGDVAAATGALALAGTGAPSEAGDTTAAAGALPIAGTASIAEAADTGASTGVLPIAGAGSGQEAADTLTATGSLASTEITGSATIVEAADTTAATARVALAAAASTNEAADSVSAAGVLALSGVAGVGEADDGLAASGVVTLSGAVAATEAGDTLAGAGLVMIQGGLSTTEDDDGLLALAAIVDSAPIHDIPSRPYRVRSRTGYSVPAGAGTMRPSNRPMFAVGASNGAVQVVSRSPWRPRR